METGPLKVFATWARTALIREVTARIAVVLAPASPQRVEQPKAVAVLEEAVAAAQTAARLEQDLGGLVTVQAIDVARFTRTGRLRSDEQHAEVELTVIGPPQRPGGPRVQRVVLWGRTTRAAHEVVGESGYGRKVERLKKLLSQPNAPARLEVRWDA